MTVQMTTWRANGKFVRVLFTPQALLIYVEGYGVKQTAPVYISLVGHPIVLVWANLKKEKHTHAISLIYAKEEL